MKYKTNFVTNSSSSSFVCNFCRHADSGWDYDLGDVGMFKCKNGHYFCECHVITDENNEKTNVDKIFASEKRRKTKKNEENESLNVDKKFILSNEKEDEQDILNSLKDYLQTKVIGCIDSIKQLKKENPEQYESNTIVSSIKRQISKL